MINPLIFQLMPIIKKIIINPSKVLKKAARSPDKKIKIMHEIIVSILSLYKFKSFLKYNANPINNGSILDKKLPRIKSSLKKPEILSALYFSYPNIFLSKKIEYTHQ